MGKTFRDGERLCFCVTLMLDRECYFGGYVDDVGDDVKDMLCALNAPYDGSVGVWPIGATSIIWFVCLW